MSILASEIIYNIKNLIAGGVQSDDTQLSDRQLMFIINYYRAKLMRQEYGNYRSVAIEEIQDLGRVDLINVDPHECGCNEGECILRTKLQIPKTMRFPGERHGLTFVGQYAGMSYQEETWQSAPWTTFSKYTGKDTKWFFKGRYIYILNPKNARLNHINLQGIFDDPREANEFKTCECDNGEECNAGFNYEYPIAAHHVEPLTKMVMQSEMQWSTILPEDTTNNSLDG
jgi:hypothetical protein